MIKEFILLTTKEGPPIILGVLNIASIEPENKGSGSIVTLNFARNKDMFPKAIDVKEGFEEIKKMIEESLWKKV